MDYIIWEQPGVLFSTLAKNCPSFRIPSGLEQLVWDKLNVQGVSEWVLSVTKRNENAAAKATSEFASADRWNLYLIGGITDARPEFEAFRQDPGGLGEARPVGLPKKFPCRGPAAL